MGGLGELMRFMIGNRASYGAATEGGMRLRWCCRFDGQRTEAQSLPLGFKLGENFRVLSLCQLGILGAERSCYQHPACQGRDVRWDSLSKPVNPCLRMFVGTAHR